MLSGGIVDRGVEPVVLASMQWSPVVAITGPRTAGKTTLARRLVDRLDGTLLDLDDPAVRSLAVDDPATFIHGLPEPVVIDEYQRAPDLLSAIKAELNRDLRPGRFIMTGSARHDATPAIGEFLTGRVALVTLWPFAQAELNGAARSSIVDRLFSSDGPLVGSRTTNLDRTAIVDLVMRGGYPMATSIPASVRGRWFSDLAQLVIERIAHDVQPTRNLAAVSTILRLASARTAQLANAADIGRDAGLSRDQAGEYLRLLRLVYLVYELPAWSTNISSRQIKRAKLHLIDTGLAAYLQGSTTFPTSDPVAAKRFGALFETFVVGEIVKQLGWSDIDAGAFHYRSSGGSEVDLVLEAVDGSVVGVEVKAGTRVSSGDAAGLRQLRDRLGSRFVAGVVVTTGQLAQRIGDRIDVVPVEHLWTPP